MRKGFRHAFVIAAILVFSIVFGLVCDAILTGIEKKKYPFLYRDEITKNAEACGIPPSLLCALIQIESGFDASRSGADGGIGLLRISAETYEQIRKILPEDSTEDPAVLFDPAVNLRAGSCWLQSLYMRYGNRDMALVAFRVGTDRADEWYADRNVTDADGTIRNLPDKEVQAYLSQVKKIRTVYERLWGI